MDDGRPETTLSNSDGPGIPEVQDLENRPDGGNLQNPEYPLPDGGLEGHPGIIIPNIKCQISKGKKPLYKV